MAPRRTCIVCRRTAEKFQLLRFVVDGEVVTDNAQEAHKGESLENILRVPRLDIAQILPGRGVYCHSEVGCLLDQRLPALLWTALRGKKSSGREDRKFRVQGDALFDWVDSQLGRAKLEMGGKSKQHQNFVARLDDITRLVQQARKTVGKPPRKIRLI